MAAVYASGSYVWVPSDEDCFVPAKVLTGFTNESAGSVMSLEDEEIDVTVAMAAQVLPMDEQSLRSVDNMVVLKDLNNASILHNLRSVLRAMVPPACDGARRGVVPAAAPLRSRRAPCSRLLLCAPGSASRRIRSTQTSARSWWR